jgi:Flp pilus assembly protein CpaB
MGYPSQRKSIFPTLLGVSALFVVVVVGTGAALWALGWLELPFWKHPPSHEGLVEVPISGKQIPMYTKVNLEYLMDDKIHTRAVRWLHPDIVKSRKLLTNYDEISGRVVDHDKPAGYPFTEADFLPKGTQAGLVAGIPAGKRALTLEAEKIKGVAGVKAGDHVDIIGTLVLDDKRTGAGAGTPLMPTLPPSMVKRATVRVLVQDGVVVSPVTTRQVPITTSSLTSGPTTRTKPVQEVVIAVDPTEIGPLTEALAVSADMMAVARSGRPDDPGAKCTTPDLPPPKYTMIETIIGGKRQVIAFPDSGGPPVIHEPPLAKRADDKTASAESSPPAPKR